MDAVLSLAYDRDNQFFLKSPEEGILWGRVFFEPLSHANIQILRKEIDHQLQSFRQKVRPYVFFPSIMKDVSGLAGKLSGKPLFFEYSLLRSESGCAVALKEWVFALQAQKPSASHDLQAYRFFKQARLSRDELSELMDLALELNQAG